MGKNMHSLDTWSGSHGSLHKLPVPADENDVVLGNEPAADF
jgi:hypothetical protein